MLTRTQACQQFRISVATIFCDAKDMPPFNPNVSLGLEELVVPLSIDTKSRLLVKNGGYEQQ